MVALVAMLLVGVGLEAHAQTADPQPLPPVVVSGPSFGPSPNQDGTGLCTTSKVSSTPNIDFPSEREGFSYFFNTNSLMQSTNHPAYATDGAGLISPFHRSTRNVTFGFCSRRKVNSA